MDHIYATEIRLTMPRVLSGGTSLLPNENIEEFVAQVIYGRKAIKKVADESDGLITFNVLRSCVRWKRENPDKLIQHIGSRGRGHTSRAYFLAL